MMKEFNENLVFDIGMHNGQDTGFYLSQGFNVVAVEANPILCKKNEVKFKKFIKTGQLIIINKAIGETINEKVTFYISEHSSWSSMIEEKAKRSNKFVSEVVVSTITLHSLIKQYGVPYYCKIDIEGYDNVAVSSLLGTGLLPKYISIELDNEQIDSTNSVELLAKLGYNKFKVVNQLSLDVVSKEIQKKQDSKFSYLYKKIKRPLAFIGTKNFYFSIDMFRNMSGKFGKKTDGIWLSLEEINQLLLKIKSEGKNNYSWCDCHATY